METKANSIGEIPPDQAATPVQAKPAAPEPKRKLGVWIACAIFALLAVGIFSGIHSRVAADSTLGKIATQTAVPSVRVTYPASGQGIQKVDLPGNVQAFNDTPIYARTSGYLKHWYVDIGSHVQQGQLMADIETP